MPPVKYYRPKGNQLNAVLTNFNKDQVHTILVEAAQKSLEMGITLKSCLSTEEQKITLKFFGREDKIDEIEKFYCPKKEHY